MSNTDGVYTLPEITIEGDPYAQPVTLADWWCEGFVAGFGSPDTTPERPLMMNDQIAFVFLAGVDVGRSSRWETDARIEEQLRDFPQIGPDLGGEAYDEVQRRYYEGWEALLHEHMPHIEVEGEPGPPPIRPNIVFVPR
jgi:hypothetical protein